jgi:phosphoribosylformimino-5-aminoimidazole carboxamide ribotide isomerase
MPLDIVAQLRKATQKRLIVAGGIRTESEIQQLHAMGVDVVVGMAIYLELLKI